MDETDLDFAPTDAATRRRASAGDERPRYFLLTAQYINDTYFAEEQEIIYGGVPNDGMEPRNPAAEKRMEEWLESLPSPLRRHEDFIADAIANRPRYEIPAPTPRAKSKPARILGKETKESTEVEVVPVDPRRVKGPKKQMGTIVTEVPSPGSI